MIDELNSGKIARVRQSRNLLRAVSAPSGAMSITCFEIDAFFVMDGPQSPLLQEVRETVDPKADVAEHHAERREGGEREAPVRMRLHGGRLARHFALPLAARPSGRPHR